MLTEPPPPRPDDRRLDEWVTRERIDTTGAAAGGEEDGPAAPGGLHVPGRKVTRHMKRKHEETHHAPPSLADMDPDAAALEREHTKVTKVKYVHAVQLGEFDIQTWYFSPYPDEYARVPKLYVCEWCFKYMQCVAVVGASPLLQMCVCSRALSQVPADAAPPHVRGPRAARPRNLPPRQALGV